MLSSDRLEEINKRNFVERMFVYPKGEDDSNKTKGHDWADAWDTNTDETLKWFGWQWFGNVSWERSELHDDHLKRFCEKERTSSEGWVESPSVGDVEIQEDVWYDDWCRQGFNRKMDHTGVSIFVAIFVEVTNTDFVIPTYVSTNMMQTEFQHKDDK